MDIDRIRKGIEAYKVEQKLLKRLIKYKGNSLTEKDFDRLFMYKSRFYPHKITGNTFILGMGINGGTWWAHMLELLQCMVRIGIIDVSKKNGLIIYSLIDEKV